MRYSIALHFKQPARNFGRDTRFIWIQAYASVHYHGEVSRHCCGTIKWIKKSGFKRDPVFTKFLSFPETILANKWRTCLSDAISGNTKLLIDRSSCLTVPDWWIVSCIIGQFLVGISANITILSNIILELEWKSRLLHFSLRSLVRSLVRA